MSPATKQGCQSHDHNSDVDLPRGLFVGLWNVATYSDLCLRLVSAAVKENPGQPLSVGKASPTGKVYKEIHVHKYVLGVGSSYFKGMFTTGVDIASQPSSDAQHETRHSAGEHGEAATQAADTNSQIIDMSCNSEEEADAMASVLKFLYTHDLPESPTVSMLSKMIIIADYLGAELCVRACAVPLSKVVIDQQHVPLVWDVLDVLRRCSECNTAVMVSVQGALSDQLLQIYSNVASIVTNEQLLHSFCSLPPDAVVAWGRSDRLRVDSENSVVVLLNKWWHSQPEGKRTEECKKQLSALVRPALLSNGYLLYVLDKLDWFIAPFPTYKYYCSAYNLSGWDSINTRVKPYSKLNKTPRMSIYEPLRLVWHIPVSQIQQLVSPTERRCIKGPSGYREGHTWSLLLEILPADDSSVHSDGDSDDHDGDDDDSDDSDFGSDYDDDESGTTDDCSWDDDEDEDEGDDESSGDDSDDDGNGGADGHDEGDGDSVGNGAARENGYRLRLGVLQRAVSGMPSMAPATPHVGTEGKPFLLNWDNYAFEDNQPRFKSVFVKAQDFADGLKEYAVDNQLKIEVTITTVE